MTTTTAIVLWLMTFYTDPNGQVDQSRWGAVDTFATVEECKRAAKSYDDNLFQYLKKHNIIAQARCLPAGTRP